MSDERSGVGPSGPPADAVTTRLAEIRAKVESDARLSLHQAAWMASRLTVRDARWLLAEVERLAREVFDYGQREKAWNESEALTDALRWFGAAKKANDEVERLRDALHQIKVQCSPHGERAPIREIARKALSADSERTASPSATPAPSATPERQA